MTQQKLDELKAREAELWEKVQAAEKEMSAIRAVWSDANRAVSKAMNEMMIQAEVEKRLNEKGAAS